MTARTSNAFKGINSRIGKDPAVSRITVELDPTKWSSRKKNLILNALRTDTVTNLGWQTAELVDDLLYHFGGGSNFNMSTWTRHFPARCVDPDKWDQCVDHLTALYRIHGGEQYDGTKKYIPFLSNMKHFLRNTQNGAVVSWVPLPEGQEEMRLFVETYMLPLGDRQRAAREALATAIEKGEPLTVSVSADRQVA